MKKMSKVYTALIMIFLFAPIAILLFFSFNEAKSLSVFSGFSLNWYRELMKDAETLGAVRNTLILALSASVVSTVMGTAAAVGINRMRNKYLRATMDTVTNIPMINPDIITGISLMLMFVFVLAVSGLQKLLLKGGEDILHDDHLFSIRITMGIVGNYSGGSCLQGGGNEIVSIEIFTLEGKKHIARGDLPRVGRYPKTVFNQDPVDLFDLIVHRFP